MRSAITAAALVIAVLGLTFFAVLTFSSTGPVQSDVLHYLAGGALELPFSSDANAHMQDVRDVMSWARLLTALALVIAYWGLSQEPKIAMHIAGAALVLIPLTAVLVPWETLFESFHTVLFPQGNWRFPSQSLLIRTYPQEYFMKLAAVWGALVVLAGIKLIVLGRYVEKLVHGWKSI